MKIVKNKILIIISFVICIIFGFFLLKNKIIETINDIKICKMYKNFYNGEGTLYDGDVKYSQEYIKRLKWYVDKEIDISSGINNYIQCIKIAVEAKKANKLIVLKDEYIQGGINTPEVYVLNRFLAEKIKDKLTEEDIALYDDDKLIELLIGNIENNINIMHKSDKVESDWFIDNDKDIRIELPYNVYFDFKCSKVKYFNEIKKILKLSFYKKDKYKFCKMKYLNNDDEVKQKEMSINYYGNNREKVLIVGLEDMYRKIEQRPTIVFGQHDYDNEWKKKNEEYAESERQRAEIKDSDIIVDTDMELISKFEKYKKQALIIVDTYKNKSKKAYFSMFKCDDAGNHIPDSYSVRELPFNNMSIEKVMEKYLADEEQVKNDEAKLQGKESKFTYDVNR